MGLLVKFIAVDSKNENIEQAKYIQQIFNKVYSNGLIKRLMVSLDELPFKLGPVKEADEEGNVFVIEFNSMENGSSDNWELVFRYGTYDASKQLEVEIYSDTYTVDKDNNYLEILKLTVKKAIVKDWKSIIWLIDKDSECLSIELYPRIYKIENLMRELINEVMAKQYGSSWWDSFVPANIKEKHFKRLKEYKAKVPAFNNVDERLMSIDIDDLGELITLKRYKWNPVYDEKISLLLNGVQSYDDNKIRELLIKQRAVDKDLWQDQFSRYLPADFKERFFAFARDRNHIMHNKLIDRTAYTQIKVSGEKIEDDLIRAIEKLSTIILSHEEQEEIEKILADLSNQTAEHAVFLEQDFQVLSKLDFIFAKAKYSNSLNACEPIINDSKTINLLQAWHPLIDSKLAVKNDIKIGDSYNSLIITGPNTGGKTVTLKTSGLLMLMAISGLHITAKEGSSIFICDNIFADIGDDQSISDSLSTFSSHMTNIANILKEATENSFILIDELGSGTDPVEGSSLAISILEKLNSLNALTLSTTHYPEIKHFALVTDGFENASVEFDLETLSPTYKLLLGVPGTSNAFAISRKLGISEEIIDRAKEFIEQDKINIEELLTNIYEDKRTIETEKQKTL